MRLDPVKIVDAAIAAGKVHPRNRDRWLVKLAAGGTQAGQAVIDLMHMWPADKATRAGWARAAAAEPASDPEDPDGIMAALWPTEQPAHATEPDRLRQLDERRGWLRNQAAAWAADTMSLDEIYRAMGYE